MRVNAVVTNHGDTLVMELPCSIYEMYEKMQSVGIRVGSSNIHLFDDREDSVQVKLYADNDEVGKHFIRILGPSDTLADVNIGAYLIDQAKPGLREILEKNILHDLYDSIQDLTNDIKLMLYESGPVKQSFYFPLSGALDEDGYDYLPVDNRYLRSYKWLIQEELQNDSVLRQHDNLMVSLMISFYQM